MRKIVRNMATKSELFYVLNKYKSVFKDVVVVIHTDNLKLLCQWEGNSVL